MIEKALVGDRRYWAWMITLMAVIGVGVIFYLRQFAIGLGVTGLGRDITWGFYIAQFTFLVGVAASAVMVVLPYYLHNYKAFGKITILGEFLAVSAVAMCMLFVFVDMGQPTRVLNMMLYPTPNSLMFWDFLSLGGYLFLNALISRVALRAERNSMPPPGWIKPFIIVSIPWAISIHTVTAFLYSGLAARPFWMTAILAPRFLASAFASGPSLLILLAFVIRRFTKFDAGREAVQKLAIIVTYAMCVNIFFVLMEIFTALYSGIPEHIEHFQFLFLGLHGNSSLVPWMWTSIALAVISLIILINPGTRANERILGFAAAMVFLSIWIDKGLGMIITGFVPTPLAKLAHYTPTANELLITVGIYAIGFFLVTLLYKIAISVKKEISV